MSDMFCIRRGQLLAPAHEQDLDEIRKLPKDIPLRVTVTRMRNPAFHRKYFALLNYAFECWEPPELEDDGPRIEIHKSFDRFRKDIAILSGFYECVWRVDGTFRFEPRSISFAKMSEEEFEELYSKTIDVIVKRVLSNYTAEDLNEVINTILEFA